MTCLQSPYIVTFLEMLCHKWILPAYEAQQMEAESCHLHWWQMRRRMTNRQLWTCSSIRGCDVKARGPGDVRKWWCRIIGKSCSKWKSRSRNITLRTDEAWMGFPLGLPAEFQEASYSEISSEVSSEVYPAPKKMTPNSGQLPCRIKWSMKDSEIILSKLFQLQVKKSNISKRTY